MIYLVAKHKDKHGCFAFKTPSGVDVVRIKNYLNDLRLSGLQIVTISRPTAFGEYAPYKFVNTEAEFVEKAQSLMV